MDVLTAHLSTVRATAERDCLVQLFEYLGAERYRHAARLRSLTKKHGVVIRKDLKRMSAVVEKLARKRAPESESAAPQEVAGRTLGLLARHTGPEESPRLPSKNQGSALCAADVERRSAGTAGEQPGLL